jgi:hypothetical protein
MIKKPSISTQQNKIVTGIRSVLQWVRPFFWQGKLLPAFWTIAGIFSVVLNIILIVALILVGRQLFALKSLIQDGLIEGLYQNFVLLEHLGSAFDFGTWDQPEHQRSCRYYPAGKHSPGYPARYHRPRQHDHTNQFAGSCGHPPEPDAAS